MNEQPTHIDLFSGIGGFALAARWIGFRTVVFCEKDEYCQRVLAKNFPDIPIINDIKHFPRRWELDKNDGICFNASCEIKNNKEPICGILKKQEWQTWLKELNAPVKPAVRELNYHQASLLEKIDSGDSVHGSAVCQLCEEKKHLTQVADNGCEEKEIQIGKMAADTSAMNVTMNQKLDNGEDACFQETNINVKIAGESQENIMRSEHITSLLGRSIQNQDLISQTESRYVKNAIINDTKCGRQKHEITLLTAGVPCQPASCAGKRRGTKDDRWLWPQTIKIIAEYRPNWCILENVRGIVSLESGMVFDNLLSDLEAIGYEVWPVIIPACAVDAKHRRDRVWIVAHAASQQCNAGTKIAGTFCESISNRGKLYKSNGSSANVANANGTGQCERCRAEPVQPQYSATEYRCSWQNEADWFAESGMGRVAHGVSGRVDRLKGLGNAIVPQVAAELMMMIRKIDSPPAGDLKQ